MSEETLEELVRQIAPVQTFKILKLFGFGEPMIHPKWEKYAAKLLNAGSFNTCIVSTNGMLLTEDNARKLRNLPVEHLILSISVDGLSPEDCEYWRKGEKFSIIRENIHRAHEILGKHVEMNIASCIVLPEFVRVDSYEEVGRILRESETWKQEEFPFVAVSTGLTVPDVDNVIPGTKIVEAAILPKAINCSIPFKDIMIGNNGDILACVCGYDLYQSMKGAAIGNIIKDNLLDAFYHNEVFEQIRKDFLSGKNPTICGSCGQCSRNNVLCLQRTE